MTKVLKYPKHPLINWHWLTFRQHPFW